MRDDDQDHISIIVSNVARGKGDHGGFRVRTTKALKEQWSLKKDEGSKDTGLPPCAGCTKLVSLGAAKTLVMLLWWFSAVWALKICLSTAQVTAVETKRWNCFTKQQPGWAWQKFLAT